MGMIDYGALLRVTDFNGNKRFINKDIDLFMEASDTGYICEKAVGKYGEEDISGNYFVYAGDEHFLLAFYKGMCKVISDGKILLSVYSMPFNSETYFFDNLPNVKISRLSKDYEEEKMESGGLWRDYVKENWLNATGNEKIWELESGKKEFNRRRKYAKRVAFTNKHGGIYKDRPYRFLAEWDYNEHHYEVIFGYGIEPQKEIWNRIKENTYAFREEETKLIDSWFME